jgi:tripartite-type tricarboxylate transporter receptor subunit TctC
VPGVTDLVGGQIASMFTPHGDFIANHKAGKLRILATSGRTRSPFVPDVATFAEQGFPELTVEEWFGFYAPARTPAAVVQAANAAINAALKEKSVIDSLAIVGLIAQGSPPAGAAFQLHSGWVARRAGSKGLLAEYAASAARPTVAFPYAVLLIVLVLLAQG